jgi:hypothetical protein
MTRNFLGFSRILSFDFSIHRRFAMLTQRQSNPRFGADDRLVCPECGRTMLLTRRGPDPEYGVAYERQKLTCIVCEHELERSADIDGDPPE